MESRSRVGEIVLLGHSDSKRKSSKAIPALIIADKSISEGGADYIVAYIAAGNDSRTSGEHGLIFDIDDLESGFIKERSIAMIDKNIPVEEKQILRSNIAKLNKEKTEEALKIWVSLVTKNYYNLVHKPSSAAKFIPGKSRINYSGRVFDEEDIMNLIDSSLEFYLTASRYDKEFCDKLSKYLDCPSVPKVNVLTSNSGSSANLLAVSALTSYKLGDLRLKEGDEVITVAAGFPTTITPIIQNRLIPAFVDIESGTYNIDPNLIEEAISDKTKAIFLAHTLGIPFDVDRILEIAEKHRLWVIEDNCDALGARYSLKREYKLIKNKLASGDGYTGTFGHIGTSSFYPAHQITMGEGGAVYTCDSDLYRILLSLRDWGRDCWCEPGNDNTCGKRFEWKLGNMPECYDHKYTYSHLGYNLKITDMQAAIGVAQLNKLKSFVEARKNNWYMFLNGLKDLDDIFILPKYPENAVISPFGFALSVRKETGIKREGIVKYLEMNNIQTRAVFAGNMIRQPAIFEGGYRYKICGELKNTDFVMNHTFWVGVYPGLKEGMIEYVIEKIREFIKR